MAPGADAYLLPALETMGPENNGVVHHYPIAGPLAVGTHIIAISVHNTDQPSNDLRLGGVTLIELKPTLGEEEK